jgi:hypothetical protein
MDHFSGRRLGWREVLRQPWKVLMGICSPMEKTCFCGGQLPSLEMYTFTLLSGSELIYSLGQCRRCSTIFWEKI